MADKVSERAQNIGSGTRSAHIVLQSPTPHYHIAHQQIEQQVDHDGEVAVMDLDFSEEAFQPRDPWRLRLQPSVEADTTEAADFLREFRVLTRCYLELTLCSELRYR